MRLTSPAFREGETIPTLHTADGQDISPPLAWSDVPDGTGSFALICDDPDAPRKTWVHWVVWNIPPEATSLSDTLPVQPELIDGTRQGKNDFGKIGYGGPSPPPGKPHRYFFKLYALDSTLVLKSETTKEELLDAMKGHILGEAQCVGQYGR